MDKKYWLRYYIIGYMPCDLRRETVNIGVFGECEELGIRDYWTVNDTGSERFKVICQGMNTDFFRICLDISLEHWVKTGEYPFTKEPYRPFVLINAGTRLINKDVKEHLKVFYEQYVD